MPKLSPVSYKRLVRVFETAIGIEGDHMIFTEPGTVRPVVIPKYDAVPVFTIKNNLRTAGISRDQYFDLLGKR
jgi:hypothetical protein